MVSITCIAPVLARARTAALAASLAGLLGACANLTPEPPAATGFGAAEGSSSGRYAGPVGTLSAPNANNSAAARYKVGAPYQAGGLWYVPAEQPDYDEVGLASWYGDAFDGRPTANGEIFDMRAVSAAHATLPMPCLVEVTNLENGRSLVVRLNDRGPYHPGRIIDLSKAGAEQLGFYLKGTAKVRVRYVGPAPLDAAPAQGFSLAQPIHGRLASHPQSPGSALSPFSPDLGTSTPSGGYLVQAGAFSSRTAAEHVARRIASAGVTQVIPVEHGGVTLYRVVLGPWSDKAAAAEVRVRVAALGLEDARLSGGF